MEICEGKRVRKAVNYAEVLCESQDDDDFADFSPPPKKIQEEKLKQANEDREKRVNGHYSDKEKDNRDNKENKHDRDKYREQDREKSDKDRSRDKNDKAKDRDKHRREDKYGDKNRKDKDSERKDESRSKLDRKGENKERTHSEVKKRDSDRGREDKSGLYNKSSLSPISASHTLTSIQKSPNKTTKPRLTIEEKLFQRELEAAIAISRLAAGDVADFKTQPDQRKTRVDKEVTYRTDAPTCTTLPGSESSPRPIHSTSQLSSSLQNQEANERNKVCSLSPRNESTNAKADTAGEITSMDLLELKRLESNAGSKNENSQPSTSTGITSKRQRKTVVFKEDTDSDSFDGFSIDADPDSDFSEGSDFALSPKKKKKKKNKEKKQLKNSKSKSPKPIQIPTPIETVTSSAIENNDLKNLSSLSVPPSPTITSLRSPYNVTPCSPLIVQKGKPTS
nr:myb-like protein X [Cherax quadricarinatus]